MNTKCIRIRNSIITYSCSINQVGDFIKLLVSVATPPPVARSRGAGGASLNIQTNKPPLGKFNMFHKKVNGGNINVLNWVPSVLGENYALALSPSLVAYQFVYSVLNKKRSCMRYFKTEFNLRFQNKTQNNPCAYVSAQCESFEFNGISRCLLVLLTIINLS